MLITESQMGFGYNRNNVMNLLDNMNYLTEAESVYAPAMVPVVENARLGCKLIALEDLMSFAENNDIGDFGYALSTICEASEIDPSTVAFTVEKAHLIESSDLASMTANLLDEGVRVAIKPLSPNSPAAILGEYAMDYLYETGDFSLLDDYITDNILNEISNELIQNTARKQLLKQARKRGASISHIEALMKGNAEALDKEMKIRNNRMRGGGRGARAAVSFRAARGRGTAYTDLVGANEYNTEKRDHDRRTREMQQQIRDANDEARWNAEMSRGNVSDEIDTTPKPQPPQRDEAADEARWNAEMGRANVSDVIDTTPKNNTPKNDNTQKAVQDAVKDWKSKPRKWFSEKIAWLHDKAQEYNEKVHKDGKNAKWYQKILSYITRAIAFLTKKMHNLFAEKGKEIGETKNGNFAYSSFHKQK